MVINLSPLLETELGEQARQRGIAPEMLAIALLEDRFLPKTPTVEPQDDGEQRLFGAAIDREVSVSHSALSSDGLYE